MLHKVVVVPVDDDWYIKEFEAGKFLEFAYSEIGCELVECVNIAQGVDMWIDEEGLLTGKSYNLTASLIAVMFTGIRTSIVGTAIITGTDSSGDTVSVPKKFLEAAGF